MPAHVGKKLPDFTRSSIPWGSFNADLSGGTVEKRVKSGLDFTKNSDPGGDEKAFPTNSGGLSSNDVANPNDNSLIKEFP